MYEEIKNLYRKAKVKRRFRQVKDGLWIYPETPLKGYGKFKGGIWVNRYDYENNKNYYLNTYLIEVDDELRRALGKE